MLAITGEMARPVIRVMTYGPDHVDEREVEDPQTLQRYLQGDRHFWVDVQGLGSEAILRAVGDVFGIHALALADVVNVPQRPKADPYENHVFIVMRMGRLDGAGAIVTEQVGMFVGRNYVLTFQEKHGDVLDPVRARLRQGGGPMRAAGPDYLAYAIWDAVIDGYYPVLEVLGERIEQLEDRVVGATGMELVRQIQLLKQEVLEMRRSLWPQRDAINSLIRDPNAFISNEVRVYLRDCYDHCVQIVDVLETYRELAWGLMDVYLSAMGNRQNEVMKVLTLVATVFIPLTFVAGVYGMNFEHMPELGWRWAYAAVWMVMLGMAAGMVAYFWRKGWLGSGQPRSGGDEPPGP